MRSLPRLATRIAAVGLLIGALGGTAAQAQPASPTKAPAPAQPREAPVQPPAQVPGKTPPEASTQTPPQAPGLAPAQPLGETPKFGLTAAVGSLSDYWRAIECFMCHVPHTLAFSRS